MSKDARNEDLDLTAEQQDQFEVLVALLADRGFGKAGPPRDTTFSEIEQFGHQVGRMVARAVDARLAQQHSLHFKGEEPCPSCAQKVPVTESPHALPLQTPDGGVTLHEPTCRCSTCRRDFFPSADRVAD